MKLGDICSKIGSGATPRGGKDSYKDYGIPIIRSQNVHDWAFSSSGLAFIDDDQARVLSSAVVEQGDVLLNITGDSVARACKAPAEFESARVNQHVAIIRANESANNSFLLAWLQANKSLLLKLASSGATRNALTKGMLENLDVNLPPIDVQNKIAALVDSIQAKIAANTKLNGYLAELQQAIYADNTKEGALTTIGEIAEVIDCLHSKKPQRQPSGKPLIQLNNIIDDGILDMTDTFYISEDDYAKWISRCEVKPGDCVITNVGRIGAVSQVPRGTTAAMGRNMTCIRPRAYAATVITALCSNAMRHEIEKRTDAGTIMNALNVRNIPKLEFYLPPAKVRDSAETTLKTIQDTRELLLKERQELAALQDALLPKLMSGEIDVSKIDLTQLNSHLA